MPEVAMKRPADMAVALVDPKKARANELAITSRKAGALVVNQNAMFSHLILDLEFEVASQSFDELGLASQSFDELGVASQSFDELGVASQSFDELGVASQSFDELGVASQSFDELGVASQSFDELGVASQSFDELGVASQSFDELGVASQSFDELGVASQSFDELGVASQSFDELGVASQSFDELGVASQSFDELGVASQSFDELGVASQSFDELGVASQSFDELGVASSHQSFDEPNQATSDLPLQSAPARTSSLLSPIMLLSGHESEVYSAAFHPEGNWLASAGHDRQILLWDTYGDCQNFAMLTGHSGAILQLAFSVDGSSLVAASTDRTVGLFDTRTGVRLKRMKGHASFVNACATTSRGTDLVCSGSDDGTVRVWDPRRRLPVHVLENGYPVTSVAFNDTAEQIFSAGIDNDIKVWDLRGATPAPSLTLRGHVDTVTSLALSKDGAYLLSNSMDKTLRCWDVRPFAPQERCIRLFQGHQHGFEKVRYGSMGEPRGRGDSEELAWSVRLWLSWLLPRFEAGRLA
ncbi:unnamed protein product [Cyprideis torosa]|uniref:Uncharacterized protein n=1 Tax=Cyprideis torosa TaxID=163714 RepID=A0A7R8WGT4_9CRUS|nr:unnamed protein product [Cyprideis torosa]CAG0898510.1 unnamed protein product [Cyprideis torosa]